MKRPFHLGLHRPQEAGSDADAELESLLEAQVAHLLSSGMAPGAARQEAFRRLGLPLSDASRRLRRSAQKRERRLSWGERLAELGRDMRFAVRSLRKSPGLTLAAALTIALAIGANTAIFSAVHAVLLRGLPVTDPDRLVMLWESNPDFGWVREDAAPANMLDWKEQVAAFADVAAYEHFASATTLTGRGEPRLLKSLTVTGNFFTVLGVQARLGQVFRPEETWAGSGPSRALLSHRAWRDIFGADPTLVGRTIRLGGRDVEVAGVLPEGFRLPGVEAEVWRTVEWDPANRSRSFFRRAHWVRPIGRLKPGVTPETANAGLQAVVTRLEREYPGTNTRMGAGFTPLREFLVGSTRLPLLVLLGAVGLLLLIACANVANLLLVRAAGREREAALRLALGAGRGRLLRQALAESAVLAGLGGIVGLGIGWFGIRALFALQPGGMLPVDHIAISWQVLFYVLGATTVCALLFSIAPVLWSARRVPADVLRDEGRTATGGRRAQRWGHLLLVSQVALALALSLGAGLLVRSWFRLQQVPPGFDSHNVLTVTLGLPGIRYDSTRKVLSFYERLEQETGGLPGVESVAVVSGVPLGPSMWTSGLAIEGHRPIEGQARHREHSPGYQRVMRVPLIKGRLLTPSDRGDAPLVVLINETLARMYFPNQDPIGQRLTFDKVPDSTSHWRTIVGVVGDEKQTDLALPAQPEILAPYPQEPRSGMTLVIRTRQSPEALGLPVRRIIARLDPELAITAMQTMDEVRAESMARSRFLTTLLLSFAGIGLLLGLVGVYGVVAQLARRRMREMGIRIALGADPRRVQWLVLRHGLAVTSIGIAVGVVLALGGTGAMRTLLYNISPGDPPTFLAVPLLILAVALCASWIPALRAARTDPCEVLRAD